MSPKLQEVTRGIARFLLQQQLTTGFLVCNSVGLVLVLEHVDARKLQTYNCGLDRLSLPVVCGTRLNTRRSQLVTRLESISCRLVDTAETPEMP